MQSHLPKSNSWVRPCQTLWWIAISTTSTRREKGNMDERMTIPLLRCERMLIMTIWQKWGENKLLKVSPTLMPNYRMPTVVQIHKEKFWRKIFTRKDYDIAYGQCHMITYLRGDKFPFLPLIFYLFYPHNFVNIFLSYLSTCACKFYNSNMVYKTTPCCIRVTCLNWHSLYI